MNGIVIFGSARSDGDTLMVLKTLLAGRAIEVVDWNDLALTPFDYDHHNRNDGFLSLAQKLAATETILLATPVYWYAMSAQMKVWFDRLTDLITIEKPIGRALAGRRAAFLAVGTEAVLPEGFETPFRRTFEYFSIDYVGCHYVRSGSATGLTQQVREDLDAFAMRLWGAP
ncbi:MAG: flavodoxin family protein [Maricaulaceae bacterium]